jgi:hypothetical protein
MLFHFAPQYLEGCSLMSIDVHPIQESVAEDCDLTVSFYSILLPFLPFLLVFPLSLIVCAPQVMSGDPSIEFLDNMSILNDVRVPDRSSSVFKDECMFSHDTPYSPEGLFVSLASFMGFGKDYVTLDHARSKRPVSLYLNLRKVAKPQPPKVSQSVYLWHFMSCHHDNLSNICEGFHDRMSHL